MRVKHTKQTGFTIVELLIVIVVIGILAAITIVAYNGVQQKATNAARVSEIRQWQTFLLAYNSQNDTYPFTSGGYCLGEGFPTYSTAPTGGCWDANMTSSHYDQNASINTLMKTMGPLPTGIRKPILGSNGTTYRLGPVATWLGGRFTITYFLEGSPTDTCPIGNKNWNDLSSIRCDIALP